MTSVTFCHRLRCCGHRRHRWNRHRCSRRRSFRLRYIRHRCSRRNSWKSCRKNSFRTMNSWLNRRRCGCWKTCSFRCWWNFRTC